MSLSPSQLSDQHSKNRTSETTWKHTRKPKYVRQSLKFYRRCSKWPPFARTHAWRRFLHWSIAVLTMSCWKWDQVTKLQSGIPSVHRRCTSDLIIILAVASLPTPWGRLGLGRGCLVAIVRGRWNPVSRAAETRWFDEHGERKCELLIFFTFPKVV